MTDDIFADIEESTIENKRKAIRYMSNNNKASITLKSLFKPTKYINITILNISSRGARISSKYKFAIKTRVILNLRIRKAGKWKIPARIVRPYNSNDYGIVFDTVQHELVDQIIINEPEYTIT